MRTYVLFLFAVVAFALIGLMALNVRPVTVHAWQQSGCNANEAQYILIVSRMRGVNRFRLVQPNACTTDYTGPLAIGDASTPLVYQTTEPGSAQTFTVSAGEP